MSSPFQVRLQELYHEIHSCHICPNMDPAKALRRYEAVHGGMDVFIVSQALAAGQLRRSGVNFFDETGRLGNTGRRLERFVNQFERTVYPPREIRLAYGTVVRQAAPPFLSVYNTELTQCFPGKNARGGHRVPTSTEIGTCLRRSFLKDEIAIIRPKLLLLMGNESRRGFYREFDRGDNTGSLQEEIKRIVRLGKIPLVNVGKVQVSVLPIQHASGANPRFYQMLKDTRLIKLIRSLLAQS